MIGSDDVVLLELQKWVGNRLPILDYIDIGDELAWGEWTIILYRHDCTKCQTELGRYQEGARTNADQRIAFVEIPPYGPRPPGSDSPDPLRRWGSLKNVKNWFVTTPAIVNVKDGVVKE
ncbi:Marine sediment metagenome DNA, contig: S03H2_S13311 (Fragment) OS=marine sediment metagenome GN=S03H2_47275 PE=4 SV=1 [Gemmata massiliana]|uniref:Marine sediment metagenome DNA, contig: S03H2_S13311 n=1 Tax=Gemmata massiliana TaxID=1210884 RepID=A0A6P2CZ38_9BACT